MTKTEQREFGWIEEIKDNQGVCGCRFISESETIEAYYRPDLVDQMKGISALQMVPRKAGGFSRTLERRMIAGRERASLRRGGFDHRPGFQDREARLRYFRHFHAATPYAFAVANRVIASALQSAHPVYLTAARRFPIDARSNIYKALCHGGAQVLDLVETFPFLLYRAYGANDSRIYDSDDPNGERRAEAQRLITGGAKLTILAALLGAPMITQEIKPGATAIVDRLFSRHRHQKQQIVDLMNNTLPTTTWEQRVWLSVVEKGVLEWHRVYLNWAAFHAPELGTRISSCLETAQDIWDYARGTVYPCSGEPITSMAPFDPHMSVFWAKVASERYRKRVPNARSFGQPKPDWPHSNPRVSMMRVLRDRLTCLKKRKRRTDDDPIQNPG